MVWVLLLFLVIALYDVIPLARERDWRGIIGFSVLFLPALALGILPQLGVEVPSIMEYLEKFLQTAGLSF